MQYKIIVDKQSRLNPSGEQKEYTVDIEELRVKGNVYDSLVITQDETYVMRRLSLSEYGVLSVLEQEVKEPLEGINIELFEGDNYIYLVDMTGNKFYAEYLIKNDFTDTYATKIEMNTAITQTAQNIMFQVNKKVDEDEFGTQLLLNSEALKMAWNQISEYLQLEGIEGKASLVIYDENDKKLIVYDSTGQHFYDGSDNIFGEIGVKTVDNQKYVAFSVPSEYGQTIQDGMAWGITTESDGKFWPILYIKNFQMANQSAGNFYGQLVLNSCDLVLGTYLCGIVCGNVRMAVDDVQNGIYFLDTSSNKALLEVYPDSSIDYARVNILDKIKFFKNQAGSNSLKIGTDVTNYCLITDDGSIYAQEIGSPTCEMSCEILECHGHIYCNNGVEPFSTKDKKRDIEQYNNEALNEVLNTDIYYYNYKEDTETCKRRVGAIIDKDYKCSKEIIGTEGKGIDLYSMISLSYKAIQEIEEDRTQDKKIIQKQQKLIEKLQENDKKKDKLISDLTTRLEKLEKEVHND